MHNIERTRSCEFIRQTSVAWVNNGEKRPEDVTAEAHNVV